MTETVSIDTDWAACERRAKEGHPVLLEPSEFLAMLRVAREQREEIEWLRSRLEDVVEAGANELERARAEVERLRDREHERVRPATEEDVEEVRRRALRLLDHLDPDDLRETVDLHGSAVIAFLVGFARVFMAHARPSYFEDVREFHDAIGAPNGETPNAESVSVARVELRETLMDEEFRELLDAMWFDDIVGIADGCADLVVTVLGTAAEYGIPFDEVWDEVHRSNMSKAGGPKRSDGKQEKGPNYRAPDIAGVLERVRTSEQGEGA